MSIFLSRAVDIIIAFCSNNESRKANDDEEVEYKWEAQQRSTAEANKCAG